MQRSYFRGSIVMIMGSRDAASSLAARWSLHGHTALVTGGSKGIGKAIVEELAGLGATVYTFSRTAAALEEALKEWKAAGLDVEGSTCDASSRDSRIQLMKKVSQHFGGKLDILVNNVGTVEISPTLDVTPDSYAFIMSTNLESAFHFSQLAHPFLKSSGRGRIVFISSISSYMTSGFPMTTYAMSKGAMNQLTRSLAAEWVNDGILVNAVAPGLIGTELAEEARKHYDFLKDIPLKRAGEPREAAAGVVFLCLPCSSFCTGQIFTLDGGTSISPVFNKIT